MMILVTGGARSGKSRHAEVLIGTLHRFCISLPRKSLMMRWLHGYNIIGKAARSTGAQWSAGNILMN